ncbi:MAG: hypothetical protein AAB874_04015, partial [Patescibacteria group bacterium]
MNDDTLRNCVNVSTTLIQNGFEVKVDRKQFQVVYPVEVWNAFPKHLHQEFSETAAFYFTYHLFFKNKQRLQYQFSPSLTHTLFITGLLMTLPEVILEIPKAKFSVDALLRLLYQSQHDVIFSPKNIKQQIPITQSYRSSEKNVVIPLSLGKDSLLTFGITRELGCSQKLVFFVEPHSRNEVNNKIKLGRDFMKEFGVNITYIPVTLGALREVGRTQWGWDLILTEYTLILLPYLYQEKANYLLWSQEQNYNLPMNTEFGMTLTMNFDETNKWRMYLSALLSYFGSPAQVGSLNEPLLEFSDTYILHNRYPEIGKYQLSCDNDHKNARSSRWCHACAECSRFYIYLLAMGIDPHRVGLKDNMLTANKMRYCDAFENDTENLTFQFTDDLLLALYFIHQRGIKGAVVELFKKKYL